MPVVNITLLPGYGPDCESRLVQRVALATRSVIAAQSAGTTVFVQHAATYMRDGRVFSGGGPEVPLVGFFAAGEVARHHVYGYTGVLTVFTGHG